MTQAWVYIFLCIGVTILLYAMWLQGLDDDPIQDEIFKLIVNLDRAGLTGNAEVRFLERFAALTENQRPTARARRLTHALLQARPEISPKTYSKLRKMFSPRRKARAMSDIFKTVPRH